MNIYIVFQNGHPMNVYIDKDAAIAKAWHYHQGNDCLETATVTELSVNLNNGKLIEEFSYSK